MFDLQVISPLVGAFGLALSIIAIIFTGLTYRRQEPRLKVKVLKCVHVYKVARITNERELRVYAFFRIANVGDRATRLNSISLDVFSEDKNHNFKTAVPQPNGDGSSLNPEPKIWIEAHDFTNTSTYSAEVWEKAEQLNLQCVFTFSHTHKDQKTKTISVMQSEPPNPLREYLEKLP
jgi:hypothetical protein